MTKAELAKHSDSMVEDIARHYVKSSTDEEGLIMWLKPGVKLSMTPELIHLREVVRIIALYLFNCDTILIIISMIAQVNYLIANCQYDSSGYDICEIYNLELDDKYNKVLKALRDIQDPVPNLRYEQDSLDVEFLHGLKIAHGIPDMSLSDLNKWKNSHSIKDIISTANSVMTDVISQKIGLTGDDGK